MPFEAQMTELPPHTTEYRHFCRHHHRASSRAGFGFRAVRKNTHDFIDSTLIIALIFFDEDRRYGSRQPRSALKISPRLIPAT
jgi:hypothetical protein